VAETFRCCKAALLHHALRWAPYRIYWSLGEGVIAESVLNRTAEADVFQLSEVMWGVEQRFLGAMVGPRRQ
jgi:hypothetical protein